MPLPIPITPVSADPSPENSVAFIVPKTSSASVGDVLPMPILPSDPTRILSDEPTIANSVLARPVVELPVLNMIQPPSVVVLDKVSAFSLIPELPL